MDDEQSRIGVDFHIHYTDATAQGIIERAKEANLAAIALVGRAEVSDKIQEYIDYGRERGIEVFDGVEMLSRINGKRVDLIGLGFDSNNPRIRHYFGQQESTPLNASIAAKQQSFLVENGFSIEPVDENTKSLLQDLLAGHITEKAIQFCKLASVQPTNAKIINELKAQFSDEWENIYTNYKDREGYKDNDTMLTAKFLWSHYFAVGKPGYIPIEPKADDFIGAIHDAGGVVLYSPEGDYNQEVWEELVEKGIDGIMGWHGDKLEIDKEKIKQIRQSGKLILGGSDYNPALEHWKVGKGSGHMFISPRRLDELKHYLYTQKLQRKKTQDI